MLAVLFRRVDCRLLRSNDLAVWDSRLSCRSVEGRRSKMSSLPELALEDFLLSLLVSVGMLLLLSDSCWVSLEEIFTLANSFAKLAAYLQNKHKDLINYHFEYFACVFAYSHMY
jgi:hypothetical protein